MGDFLPRLGAFVLFTFMVGRSRGGETGQVRRAGAPARPQPFPSRPASAKYSSDARTPRAAAAAGSGAPRARGTQYCQPAGSSGRRRQAA
jgi:hypothetical protein